MRLSTELLRARSATRTSVSTPRREHCSATSAKASRFLPTTNRLNPPPANSNASALPMPDDAPVTMAHLSDRLISEALITCPENICRIQTVLQVAFPLHRRLRHDSRQEHSPQFADAVMVRKRPAGF